MYEFRKARFAFAAVTVVMLGMFSLAGPADAGTLTVQAGSKHSGSFGLQVTPDATPAYVQSSHPSAEKTYRVRFYVNLTRLNLASNTSFEVFNAYDGADPLPAAAPAGNSVLRAVVRQLPDGSKVLDVFTRLNNGSSAQITPAGGAALANGWRHVELEWSAVTPGSGVVNVWVNGVSVASNTTLANDAQVINYSRWGSVTGTTNGTPPPGAGTNTFRLDDFGSQRTGYMGQVQVFTDVPLSDPLFRFIQGLYSVEVTAGCGTGTTFCPGDNVTREQMAVFLERGKRGPLFTPPVGTGIFADVPAGFFRDFIEQLFADGITAGCSTSPMLYCPSSNVTRDQMAVFLLRAKYGSAYTPPPATGTVFNDVPANAFAAAFIEQLAAEGITTGCGGGSYCPSSPVTRAQMAVFLVRTFSFPTQELGP